MSTRWFHLPKFARLFLERFGVACFIRICREDREASFSLRTERRLLLGVRLGWGLREGFSWHIGIDDEDPELGWFVWLPFGSISIDLGVLDPRVSRAPRQLGASLTWGDSSPFLYWKVWVDPNEMNGRSWRSGSVFVDEWLLGSRRYSSTVIEAREVVIPMPEGAYGAIVTIADAEWRYLRWPWWPLTKRRRSAQVEIPNGIPVPGKGENSWDCGDDALFSTGSNDRTVEAAIGKVVESVIETRQRRQGHHGWKREATS